MLSRLFLDLFSLLLAFIPIRVGIRIPPTAPTGAPFFGVVVAEAFVAVEIETKRSISQTDERGIIGIVSSVAAAAFGRVVAALIIGLLLQALHEIVQGAAVVVAVATIGVVVVVVIVAAPAASIVTAVIRVRRLLRERRFGAAIAIAAHDCCVCVCGMLCY